MARLVKLRPVSKQNRNNNHKHSDKRKHPILKNLDKLQDTELHSTHMLADDELIILSNLGINATCGTEVDIN